MRAIIVSCLLIVGAVAQADPPRAIFGAGRVRIVPESVRVEVDPAVRRAQAGPTATPLPQPGPPATLPGTGPIAGPGGGSLSLEAALYGAITGNPDLIALRNSTVASAESVEVARRFPTTLNPTLWVDLRPINLIPPDAFNTKGSGGAARTASQTHLGNVYFYLSWRQPIELGHQTTHRYHIARAAYSQQQWTVMQAEMLALVQTYRFFQTAAYRREKLRVAHDLADFNDRLLHDLRKGLEANTVTPADLTLAQVENQATRQQVEVAEQDYANALADLRNQIGQPETAEAAEPFGAFALPRVIPEADVPGLVRMALQSRPEIHVARAQATGAEAAVRLAKGDRIPTPIVGPLYQRDEVGVQYVGLVYITPIPILNNGRPLQLQREADHRRTIAALQQVEFRTVTQVRAAAAKWNAANRLVSRTNGLTAGLRTQMSNLERLFEANQATLAQLLQARQRLIQLENAELDALWQATQAQADLLLALGAPCLIAGLNQPTPGLSIDVPATAVVADRRPASAPESPPTPVSRPAAAPAPPRPPALAVPIRLDLAPSAPPRPEPALRR